MRKITSNLLRKHDACAKQVELFIALGGDHLGQLTESLCLKYATWFNWEWAADKLLTRGAHVDFRRRERTAFDAQEDIIRSAKRLFDTKNTLMAASEYANVTLLARSDYRRAIASAFYRAWVSPENQPEEIAT